MDDKVFAPNTDGNLYVLSLGDGLTTKTAERVIELGGSLWAQPVSDGSLVIVPAMNHRLHAIDAQSYEVAWPAIDLGGAIPGTPLVASDGMVYAGSLASEVVKVSPDTGTAVPFASAQGWVWGGPVQADDRFYFGDLEGYFYAVSSDGKPLWTIQPDGPITGSPLVMSDHIVFATESGSVYAVDQEGKILWQRAVGGQIYPSPVVGGDRIFVAPMGADYLLSALDANGNMVWNFQPEK